MFYKRNALLMFHLDFARWKCGHFGVENSTLPSIRTFCKWDGILTTSLPDWKSFLFKFYSVTGNGIWINTRTRTWYKACRTMSKCYMALPMLHVWLQGSYDICSVNRTNVRPIVDPFTFLFQLVSCTFKIYPKFIPVASVAIPMPVKSTFDHASMCV